MAAGKISALMAFQEFLLFFDQDVHRDGRISREEWMDYFSAVSCVVRNDAHFRYLVSVTFRLGLVEPNDGHLTESLQWGGLNSD